MPEFLRGLTIFKMSFFSSFDIIDVVPDLEAQDPNIFYEFPRGLTIFKMSFISSFDIINFVPDIEAQDPNIFYEFLHQLLRLLLLILMIPTHLFLTFLINARMIFDNGPCNGILVAL